MSDNNIKRFMTEELRNISLDDYFRSDKFENFRNYVKDGQEIAAAKAFQEVTNSPLDVCKMMTDIAREIL